MPPVEGSGQPGGAATGSRSVERFDAYSVLTPERVSLQYEIAGVGSRVVAAAVDSLLQLLAWVVLLSAVLGTVAAVANTPALAAWFGSVPMDWVGWSLFGLVVLATFAIFWGYYMLFEIAWSGQTPGKRLLGIRAIREAGYPILPADAIVRNLVRIVDFLPGGYALGLLVMLLNARARRLGDFAAGTIVVREGARRALLGIGPLGAGTPEPPVASLSPDDATLARDFLARRGSMDPRPRAALAARLAQVVARRYGLQSLREELGDEPFLERVAGE